jgi:hypothetical protein
MSVLDPLKNDANRFAGTARDLGTNAAKAFETLGGAGQGAGSGIVKVLLWPVRAVVTVARWPVAMANGAFKHYPKLSAATTAVAGIGLAASALRGRAEKRTQQEFQDNLATAQAPQPSYMNSASQAEVDARIAADRSAGVAPASQAAAVNAAREQVQAPEAARG